MKSQRCWLYWVGLCDRNLWPEKILKMEKCKMRNENFWGCVAICVLGCIADSGVPVLDVSVATVGVAVGA